MSEEIVEQIRRIEEKIVQLNIHRSDDSPELTNQFGFIKFGVNEIDVNSRLSQYIRLSLHTEARKVVEFLQYGWCLPTPELIISVTGGGKKCRMSTHLRKTFQHGLVVAAATTNAWLITAGTNAGVMKEVGEALKNYRYKNRRHGLEIPCLGIGSWEYTAGTEQLDRPLDLSLITNDSEMNKSLVRFRSNSRSQTQTISLEIDDENLIRSYSVKSSDEKRCDLEENHTHFLLFDGQSSNVDCLLLQRAAIEKHSRHIKTITSVENILIPIVMVLVEGGPFSIRTICHALQSQTPLVVVKGSGRAADLIADLHLFFSHSERKENENDLKTRNRSPIISSDNSELNSIFERSSSVDHFLVDEMKTNLCELLIAHEHLITIFEFDSPRHHGNLEDAILEALFNAAKSSGDNRDENQCLVAELKLAMAWKKFDYAQKNLLTEKTITKWTESDLSQCLVDALRRDYVDFVDLLIEYGTSLEKLTVRHLEQLYQLAQLNDGLPVETSTEGNLPTRIDYYKNYFADHPQFLRIPSEKSQSLGINAAREFFFWSLFFDRFELSRYLCSKTWNSSISPLIGSKIYRLASDFALHSETKELYRKNANQFDLDAMSIIDQCFVNDEHFAVDLLRQKALSFDNFQSLEVAEEAHCRSFLASKAVQKYLDQKWFGHINYKRRAIYLRIFLCTLFVPLIPIFSASLPYVSEQTRILTNTKRFKTRSSITLEKGNRSTSTLKGKDLSFLKKMIYFYQAPIVRFYYSVIFFLLFLGLFSDVLLTGYFPLNLRNDHQQLIRIKYFPVPISELILHLCVWSLILEEFHQFYSSGYRNYFTDVWSLIDLTAIILYLVAFLTRFILIESFFIVSKICFSLDLIVWFVGTLRIFSAFERLGPKLVMIFDTMKDLLFFICFILIFLCGFSITSWSLISSTSQIKWIYNDDGQLLNVTVTFIENKTQTWRMLREITNYGVWKVFGQVEPIVGEDPYSDMAFILAIIFVAIANVLLLNVLVALFNVTIQNVQNHAHDLWRYQRFLIVNEYAKATPLPAPFNIIYYMFCFIQLLIYRIKMSRKQSRRISSERLISDVIIHNTDAASEFKVSDMMRRESAIANDYWYQIFKHNRVERMDSTLERMEEKLDHLLPLYQCQQTSILMKNRLSKESDV